MVLLTLGTAEKSVADLSFLYKSVMIYDMMTKLCEEIEPNFRDFTPTRGLAQDKLYTLAACMENSHSLRSP